MAFLNILIISVRGSALDVRMNLTSKDGPRAEGVKD